MREPIGRRKFLALSAATAALGSLRPAWAAEATIAAKTSKSSPSGHELNGIISSPISTSALAVNPALMATPEKAADQACRQAVAKADCYGHGWLQCQEECHLLADWVAVATPEEALAVRQAGWRKPILVLMASRFPGGSARERLRQLISQDVTLTLAAMADLAVLSAAAAEVGRPARVHLKIDTGMSRSGVLPDGAPALVHQARRQSGVALSGSFTRIMLRLTRRIKPTQRNNCRVSWPRSRPAAAMPRDSCSTAPTPPPRSIAPETHFDMVRVGIAMYGHQPSDEMQRRLPLRPVLRLVGRLTQVKDIPAGSKIGYGQTYQFERPATIGLVPVGYADGYCRCFSNNAVMRIAGRPAPIRGRVCMDQTMIELTGLPGVKVGDEVEIIGGTRPHPTALRAWRRWPAQSTTRSWSGWARASTASRWRRMRPDTKNPRAMKKIAIIGAGISGLAAATALLRANQAGAGVEFTLFERSHRLGGVMATERMDGCLIEAGPDSFLSEKSSGADFCGTLGLGDQIIGSNDDRRKTYIVVNNRLLAAIPDGLMFMVPTKILPTIASPLFTWSTKFKMALEFFAKPSAGTRDETVGDMIRRHYGQEVVERLADPLLSGVYGGDADSLSVEAVLPRFAEIERNYGSLGRGMLAAQRKMAEIAKRTEASERPRSLFSSLTGGMQQMADTVARTPAAGFRAT